MSGPDDLDRLREGLRAGAPAPDPAARAEALRRAMESFDARQDLGRAARQGRDRRKKAGFRAGVRAMFLRLTSRPALAATASFAVLAVGAWIVTGPPGPVEFPALKPSPDVLGYGEDLSPAVTPAPSAAPSLAAESTVQPTQEGFTAMPGVVAKRSAEPLVQDQRPQFGGGDTFAAFDPNTLKVAADEPVSTFSIDVDTASWSWVRGSLNLGQLPSPASVRLEEMVNYFRYSYPAPEAGEAPFRPDIAVMPTPWNSGTQLVRIGLQGRLPDPVARPPVNLVFLIDTSGSMEGPERLGLLKYAFRQLIGQLGDTDKVAIVAYAGSAGEVLSPTPATDRATILAALDSLRAGGSTAGGAGLELAYKLAERMGGKGSVNRVVLATDGDFNVGLSSTTDLAAYVAEKRKTGVYLSVLGFGRGNLNDAVMQALAQSGNGTAAYIDSAAEARKVLADQVGAALFPIAGDVKVQVEWNPAVVAEYRLLGYETRALRREEFSDDKVDAGDIGAGHQVTALYEVTPVGSPARLTDPLRYEAAPTGGPESEAGWLRLRYKAPGETVSALIEAPIPAGATDPDEDARFAAAIAGFAQLLTGGRYLHDWGWADVVALADEARGDDPFGYRAEAVRLMRLAEGLAGR